MVTFGKKATREEIEKAGESAGYEHMIWNFRPGSTTVRFLDDLADEEWTGYWEHYDGLKKKFFPCPGQDEDCPGCEAENKASKKYLTNVLIQDAEDEKVKAGYVSLYKVPSSLVNKAMRRVDRYGTICDRDYEVIRIGQGMDTEYDMETGDKGHVDVAQYEDKLTNHEEALKAAWDAYAGSGKKAADKPKAKIRAVREEPDFAQSRLRTSEEETETFRAKAEKAKLTRVPTEDDAPPTEPRPQSDSADDGATDDEEVLSEDAVRNMDIDELHVLYKRTGLPVPASATTAAALADHLIEKLAE